MRWFKQQLPDENALEVLKNAKQGVLFVNGDDGWPYGVWLNLHYREADGRIYFHGAKEGAQDRRAPHGQPCIVHGH